MSHIRLRDRADPMGDYLAARRLLEGGTADEVHAMRDGTPG